VTEVRGQHHVAGGAYGGHELVVAAQLLVAAGEERVRARG
jgi:hypothetical protein